ncbi:cytohesin-1-like isoform X1 [Daphnia pulicaria]|uniref:cytohesin-1-like isoform X1 n=1 Tax=Daphnia pulicaria TaxID=35523 RepID=UPI001EEA94AC|nr:cytohesin-1-like isoform X1 [Daphnia pulicaria]
MSISFAMTMTSPVELAGKSGWFGSLRRNRLPTTPDKLTKSNTMDKNGTLTNMTGAKSLSSLHKLSVNHHSTTVLNERLDVSSSPRSKPRWRLVTILGGGRSKKSDSSVDISDRNSDSTVTDPSSRPAAVTVALPSVKEQLGDDDRNLSQFCTLPRKRSPQNHLPDCGENNSGGNGNGGGSSSRVLPPLSASTSRSRAHTSSTASLDRRKKRSTVWYTISESEVYGGGGRSRQLKDEIAEVTAEMESLDNTGEDSKNAARAKQLSLGRKKFNMDPKKGIEFLLQQGLLQNTPQDIAAFLYRGEGLSKTAIGDYLGEKSPFHEQVLKAFVDLHDFTDLIIVQALRQFLWSFRLPGEAQKIDRMMETFAQRYCQLNPNIFSNPDTCYVLSFSVIILNTSLHNPSVKEKPTLDKFIAMNRGINDGKDIPRDIQESIYDSIKAEPFKIPEDDGNDLMHTFFNPDREGWLWKQGGRYKSWKRRWFILNDNCLYYFEYTTDKEPRGIIPLENIQVREVPDRNKPNCFELYATGGNDFIKACKTDSEGKVVEGKHTVYRMSAAEQAEKDEWIACIRQSISHNPFYDMLAARKKKAQKSGHRTKP